jgi:hypothetical protein
VSILSALWISRFALLGVLGPIALGDAPAGAAAAPLETSTIDPQAATPDCVALAECRSWVRFRTGHPSPYQAMAMSREGGEAVIILSEPPPSLSREALEDLLRNVFGDELVSIRRYRMPTGADGWLEDVVLRVRLEPDPDVQVISGDTLQPWQVPSGVADRLRFVGAALWGTMDGFWLDEIGHGPASAPIGELRVTPSMIDAIVAKSSPSWRPLAGAGGAMTFAELETRNSPGAFVTADGVVALVVPQQARVGDVEAPFRRFAVASDLLVGAVRTKEGPMVLLGRARRLPLSELPPLRFETFALLARNQDDELAQSYERQRIFAGRIMSGDKAGWDWAPILLSAQLDDSEFGTLLNEADQLLKSWSQHGDVKYYSFNYPAPGAYPFGSEAASQYFLRQDHASSLIFNWNTDNFATLIERPNYESLTVDRSNALPILYIPGDIGAAGSDDADERAAADDAALKAWQARDYFAAQGSPVIVQVARDVLLAQATRSLLTPGEPPGPRLKARSDTTAQVLQQEARAWVTRLLAANTLPPAVKAQVDDLRKDRTPEQIAEVVAMPQAAERDAERAFGRLQHAAEMLDGVERELHQLADEGEPIVKRYDDLDNQMKALKEKWIKRCGELGGTRTNEGGDLVCSYKAGAPGFGELDDLKAKANALSAALQALDPKMKALDSDAGRLTERRKAILTAAVQEKDRYESTIGALRKTLALRPVFESMSGAADLDAVHQKVLVAVSGPTNGSIRTPSIVLSQSQLMRETVGGHNISLTPVRARVMNVARPRIGVTSDGRTVIDVPSEQVDQVGAVARGDDSAARHLTPTAIQPGGDTLLASMRAAQRLANEPALLADAARCQTCDAVITRQPDGTIFLVRLRPAPPEVEQIFGKSGMIGALGGPPPLSVVEFNNFPPGVVGDVSAAVRGVRGAANGGSGNWGGRFGSGPSNGPSPPRIYMVDREDRPTMLEVSSAQPASLEGPMDFRGSTVQEAEAGAWQEKFGLPPDGTRILVDFGPDPARRSWLGILVRAANGQGLVERVVNTVRLWIGRQGSALPSRDALIGLRETIRREGVTSIDFYLREGADVVRVANADGRTNDAG